MSLQEQAQLAHSAPVRQPAPAFFCPDLRGRLRHLIRCAQTVESADAWAKLAAHVRTFERSSYATYLDARLAHLLDGASALSPAKASGVRRILEAILEDILQDPRRRGDAPADAATFNDWWDCVVGLVRLEAQRVQQIQQAIERRRDPCADNAGLELALWVQRLAGLWQQSVLRRTQLIAELLTACGVPAHCPADDAELVACYQARARGEGLRLRASAARAALCDASVGCLLRLLAPQRCCALSKVSVAPQADHVALADYLGCWAALGRISAGDLQLESPRMRVVTTPANQSLLQVSFVANGQSFQFDYQGEAGGFDEHFVEHLNRVAQSLRMPGSFLVDRFSSDSDVEIAYLPLRAAAALQISGALSS